MPRTGCRSRSPTSSTALASSRAELPSRRLAGRLTLFLEQLLERVRGARQSRGAGRGGSRGLRHPRRDHGYRNARALRRSCSRVRSGQPWDPPGRRSQSTYLAGVPCPCQEGFFREKTSVTRRSRMGRVAYEGTATSSRPCWRVFQASVAHLIRTGNFTTPWSASRSPRVDAVELGRPGRRRRTRLRASTRGSTSGP